MRNVWGTLSNRSVSRAWMSSAASISDMHVVQSCFELCHVKLRQNMVCMRKDQNHFQCMALTALVLHLTSTSTAHEYARRENLGTTRCYNCYSMHCYSCFNIKQQSPAHR